MSAFRRRRLISVRQFLFAVLAGPVALRAAAVDQQAYLKASNTGSGDSFGVAVAASGDTVVVGALWEDSNAIGVNGDQANNNMNGAGAAYVFVRTGATWAQQAYLKASNSGMSDEFGTSVAISGDTIVIGAPNERSDATGVNGNQANDAAPQSGAAYVFVRNGAIWSQQAYLKASNTGAFDRFGVAVAISGDTIVIGADGEASAAVGIDGEQSDNSAGTAGAAYVFVREGTNWTQQAYLKGSNTAARDNFGHAVSVSGDTVVVGAPGEDSNATGIDGDQLNNAAGSSGAAYVYVRNGVSWSQQAYVKASNTDTSDSFGNTLAIAGDILVVGAHKESSVATGVNGNQTNNSAHDAGAAYVFARSSAVWGQQAYLKASNTGGDDWFGASVAVSAETVLVGAQLEDSNATGVNGNATNNAATNSGAAYLFGRSSDGVTWSQRAYLKASNCQASDAFGAAVAVSDGTVVIGAPAERSGATGVNGNQADNNLTTAGAGYLFQASAACGGGDANCDGIINNFDIDPYVIGLLAVSAENPPAEFLALGLDVECWQQRLCWGDVDQDLAFNNFDIDPFVACVLNPPGPGQTCP